MLFVTYMVMVCYMFTGEFGDFEPSEHEPGYLDDFPYLEDKVRRMTISKSGFLERRL